MLRHFVRAGIPKDDLVALYKCFLLPVIDYASVVYHSILTAEQVNDLELLQKRTLRIIFGFGDTYEEMLEQSNLDKLSTRRLK